MASGNTRLFAVLIGINTYREHGGGLHPLRGAVPDVEEFQSYLQTYLAVPSEHILVLTDSKATRAAIVEALRDLAEDGRIDRGDAILIYYAGHGTELTPPANWEAGGRDSKIQAIVPYDCTVSETYFQPEVPPIPDHLLENLLSDIAGKKGDNITVILDCCHSTSGTRALVSSPSGHISDVRVRGVTYTRHLSQDLLDQRPTSHHHADTWFSGTSRFIPRRLRSGGLSSHVLLAACNAGEKAHEQDGHGCFTTALLKLLKSVPLDQLRYSDILGHRDLNLILNQNPHCEGLNKNRILFNAKVLPAQRKSFRVRYTQQGTGKQGAQYIVDGGKIHSLTPDSEFEVYRKSDIYYSSRIGILHADKVDEFELVAKLPPGAPIFDTATPTIAVQTNSTTQAYPRIHIPAGDSFHGILHCLSKGHLLKRLFDHHIPLSNDSQTAHVKINLTSESKVKLTILDTAHGLLSQKLSPLVATFDPDPDDLARILSSIAHFYREVKFINNNPQLWRSIAVEFYELQWVSVPTNYGGYERWLQPVGPNLSAGGTISLVLPRGESDREEKLYGMKIVNNSKQDLSVNVYRFNHDLSISPWADSGASQSYHPSTDLPLKHSGGSLAIGYGAGGYPPLHFNIKNGLDVEVVFLKIYISTKAVDFSHLSQASPLCSTRAMKPYQPKKHKDTWTDIVVPMVLRRYQNPFIPHTRRRNY